MPCLPHVAGNGFLAAACPSAAALFFGARPAQPAACGSGSAFAPARPRRGKCGTAAAGRPPRLPQPERRDFPRSIWVTLGFPKRGPSSFRPEIEAKFGHLCCCATFVLAFSVLPLRCPLSAYVTPQRFTPASRGHLSACDRAGSCCRARGSHPASRLLRISPVDAHGLTHRQQSC